MQILDMITQSYKYDAFISHAVEDKIGFANDFCRSLEKSGVRVWYSGKDLVPGYNLAESIEDGMRNSRFGVVIFSPTYLKKDWTMRECYHFWDRDGKTKNPIVVLPVYYNTTAEEVSKKILLVGNRISANADRGVDDVVKKIHGFITKETIRVRTVRTMTFATALLILSMVVLSLVYWQRHNARGNPATETVELLVSDRIAKMQPVDTGTGHFFSLNKVTPSYIDSIHNAYTLAKSYYRNEYEFRNGFKEVKARKNVNEVLGLLAQDLNPSNSYKMDSVAIFQLKNSGREITYRYTNLAPVIKTIEPVSNDNDLFVFNVHYKNNIRMIEVSLLFPSGRKDTKRHKMQITGLKPMETYQLYRSKGEWKLRELETTPSEGNR